MRNGSLMVGDSGFFRSSFETRGPRVATFSRVGSATTDKCVVHSFYLVNHPGGAGHVIPNMLVETSVNASPAAGIWGFLSTLAPAKPPAHQTGAPDIASCSASLTR